MAFFGANYLTSFDEFYTFLISFEANFQYHKIEYVLIWFHLYWLHKLWPSAKSNSASFQHLITVFASFLSRWEKKIDEITILEMRTIVGDG